MTGDAPPNVLLIVADDLGWGDLACHGNPTVRTPRLDRLRGESGRLTRYCSGPLCTPARASLFTGRYPYRTRAIDTYCGRSMLNPDERTLAEVLRDRGHRTGLFGKWHLGDCHPMRAIDKGFDEALVHQGGGLRQPANRGHFDGRDGYFDPELMRDGHPERRAGYCTDIFADAAIEFVARPSAADRPFFACVAFNAPHAPLEVADAWADPYRRAGLDDRVARLYGMVENLDANVGRLLDALDDAGAADRTVVIFTSDHGPQAIKGAAGRYDAGLRGAKGTMYEGGLRVPCWWRWPGRFPAGRDVGGVANPIDVLPTLGAVTGAAPPADRAIDGIDLSPALSGRVPAVPDRRVFLQWHRGNAPVPFRNYAVVTPRFKLLRPREDAPDELYDVPADPGEARDVAADHPGVVADLRDAYAAWFDDVSATRGPGNYDPPRIVVGSPREEETVLTRQDWRLPDGVEGWTDDRVGAWDVLVERAGPYRVRLDLPPVPDGGAAVARLSVGDVALSRNVGAGESTCVFEPVALTAGPHRLAARLDAADGPKGVKFVRLTRRPD